jgi:hypothetical protein
MKLPTEAIKLPRQAMKLPTEAIKLPEQAIKLPEQAMKLPVFYHSHAERPLPYRRPTVQKKCRHSGRDAGSQAMDGN